MTKEELLEINIKVPQAIAYLLQSAERLLLEVNEMKYERDEYRSKYQTSEELRKLADVQRT